MNTTMLERVQPFSFSMVLYKASMEQYFAKDWSKGNFIRREHVAFFFVTKMERGVQICFNKSTSVQVDFIRKNV